MNRCKRSQVRLEIYHLLSLFHVNCSGALALCRKLRSVVSTKFDKTVHMWGWSDSVSGRVLTLHQTYLDLFPRTSDYALRTIWSDPWVHNQVYSMSIA